MGIRNKGKLGGDGGKQGPGLLCQYHGTSLSHADHPACRVKQLCCLAQLVPIDQLHGLLQSRDVLPQSAAAQQIKGCIVFRLRDDGLTLRRRIAGSGCHRGLGQLQLERIVSSHTQPAAEPGDGGIRHLAFFCQLRYGHVLRVNAVGQYIVGHLFF